MDYLNKLKTYIKKKKIKDAGELLAQLEDIDKPLQQEVIRMIAVSSDNTAYEILSFIMNQPPKDKDLYNRLMQLVIDRAHLNFKFARILVENAGQQTLQTAAPLLKHILSNETDKDLLSDIIRCSGKNRLDKMAGDLAEFIFYDDIRLKSDAVKALERIASRTALEKLLQASKTEKCDQDILDAVDVLKRDLPEISENKARVKLPKAAAGLENLKLLGSPKLEERFKTILSLLDRDLDLSRILSDHKITAQKDVLINLLWITGRTIPVEAVNILFDFLKQKDLDNRIKFAVYNALAEYPTLESAASILKGLEEPAMHVRIAAAKALDSSLSDFVCAEIKNQIESGTKKGASLAQTILDARAVNLIEYLMISDAFSFIASNYLFKSAPIQVLETFISILEKRNLKSTARKYTDKKLARAAENRDHFIIISPCRATLDVYSKLVSAMGCSASVFKKSQDAFESIATEKPAAVISDIMLADMTGMDMAGEVRQIYPKTEVAFIISNPQKNLDQGLLQQELDASGVDAAYDFPATLNQLKSCMK